MKHGWIEILLNLFEKSLTELKESQLDTTISPVNEKSDKPKTLLLKEEHVLFVKATSPDATRVMTYEEQTKLTKASLQFLTRLRTWGIIQAGTLDLIITQLMLSDSVYITLDETKWTIRKTLAEGLTSKELAFLDLVLYQKEDQVPLH